MRPIEEMFQQIRRATTDLEFALMPETKGDFDFIPDPMAIQNAATRINAGLNDIINRVEGTL